MVGHPNVVDGAGLGLGPGVVSIPDSSLTIDPTGSITARVIDSVFDGGMFRIQVDVSGTVIAVSADQREVPGADIRIQIDGRSAIRLTS